MDEPDALEKAFRALRTRDRSIHELEQRLQASGVSEPDRRQAIETLVRTGLADDGRFAENRAATLAGRGAGDGLIRHELARAGVSPELIDDTLDGLEPEADRARLIVERRGAEPRTARYLAGKGFSEEVIAGAIAGPSSRELG